MVSVPTDAQVARAMLAFDEVLDAAGVRWSTGPDFALRRRAIEAAITAALNVKD
jgi:hypothetical protein